MSFFGSSKLSIISTASCIDLNTHNVQICVHITYYIHTQVEKHDIINMILYAHINRVDPFLVYSDKLLLGISLFCFFLLFFFTVILFSYLLCSSLTNLLVSCIVTICVIAIFSFVTWSLLTILLEYLTVLLENLYLLISLAGHSKHLKGPSQAHPCNCLRHCCDLNPLQFTPIMPAFCLMLLYYYYSNNLPAKSMHS